MGIVRAHAGRRGVSTPILMATTALLIMLAVIAVSASIGAQNAQALPTFDTAVNGVGPCSSCHSYSFNDAFHNKTTHKAQACGTCHTLSTATPPLPSACVSCHGATATIIAAQTLHGTAGCGTTNGCHGYASPTPTPSATATPTPTPTATATVIATKVTLKVTPKTIRLRKTVKASGVATPATTVAGKKVTVRVDRKKGAKWVKVKTARVTGKATGAYAWKYKPGKKGTYRMTASIAKTATSKASKSRAMTFKVK